MGLDDPNDVRCAPWALYDFGVTPYQPPRASRVDIESIDHSKSAHRPDRQRMRTVGQVVRSVDRALVSLLPEVPALVDHAQITAVQKNPGSPDARLYAADPAHRGPDEPESDARVRVIGFDYSSFAPDSGGVAVPTTGAVGNGWIRVGP